MTPEQAFGRVLRDLRRARGLSQEQLGFESGFSHVYIGELERGEKSATLGTIFRLAGPLDVRPSELLQQVEEQVSTVPPRRSGPKSLRKRP